MKPWLTGFTLAAVIASLLSAATWSKWNSITVGSSAGNVSKWNAGTIGTSAGNIGAWNGLVSPGGGAGGWSLKQQASGFSATCPGDLTSCSVTVTATTSGSVGIVWAWTNRASANIKITGISGGSGTAHLCPGSACFQSCTENVNGSIDQAWYSGYSAGTTSISVTLTGAVGSAGDTIAVGFTEFGQPGSGSLAYDTGSAAAVAGAGGSGAADNLGIALTLSGSNDAIQQIAAVGSSINTISSPYTLDSAAFSAAAINQTSGGAPTWNHTPGTDQLCESALALKH